MSLKPPFDQPGWPASAALAVRQPEPVFDAASLDRLRELDPTGATGLIGRVMQAFENSAARLTAQLATARRDGDRVAIRRVAHTLKSASASIGALRLSQLCAQAEAAVQGGSTDLAAPLDAMTSAIDDALRAVADLKQDERA